MLSGDCHSLWRFTVSDLVFFAIGWIVGAVTTLGGVFVYAKARAGTVEDDEPGGGWER